MDQKILFKSRGFVMERAFSNSNFFYERLSLDLQFANAALFCVQAKFKFSVVAWIDASRITGVKASVSIRAADCPN